MKKCLLASLIVVGVALMAPGIASAQAVGSTDIDVSLPDIVILHYFSNVDITITQSALGNFLTGVAGDAAIDEGVASPAAGGFTQNVALSPSALSGDPSSAVLTIQNAWAVRSISLAGGTDTQLVITNSDNTLDHASTSASITVTGVAVDDGSSNGSTVTFPAPGLVSPRMGDVELTLDLTNAVNAGEYQDGEYTLTASNI
jgi:hypothetical protein